MKNLRTENTYTECTYVKSEEYKEHPTIVHVIIFSNQNNPLSRFHILIIFIY